MIQSFHTGPAFLDYLTIVQIVAAHPMIFLLLHVPGRFGDEMISESCKWMGMIWDSLAVHYPQICQMRPKWWMGMEKARHVTVCLIHSNDVSLLDILKYFWVQDILTFPATLDQMTCKVAERLQISRGFASRWCWSSYVPTWSRTCWRTTLIAPARCVNCVKSVKGSFSGLNE